MCADVQRVTRDDDARVRQVLEGLHRAASREMGTIIWGALRSLGRGLQPEHMAGAYIAISREQGQLITSLIRSSRSQRIVEFGTSFGISTIYLAAAARHHGGHVWTSEILPKKCEVARRNFDEADVSEVITLLEGDVLETLPAVDGPIDFLLLDGWKELYLPVLQALEPKLRPGALIFTDNVGFSSTRPFRDYVRNQPDRYLSVFLQMGKGGTELSCFIGGEAEGITPPGPSAASTAT